MIDEETIGIKAHAPFIYPALMLGIFFLIPFGTMARARTLHTSTQLQKPIGN